MTNPYRPPKTVNVAPRKAEAHRRLLWMSFACMASGAAVALAPILAMGSVMYWWWKSPPIPGEVERFEQWMGVVAMWPYISLPLMAMGVFFALRSAWLAPRRQRASKQP